MREEREIDESLAYVLERLVTATGAGRAFLELYPAAEARELTAIYVARGLTPELAQQVSAQLMAHDALGAHARDELQVSTALAARPVQAALTSAASFAVGAALPLAVAVVSPASSLLYAAAGSALVFLALLGALAAHTGGAGMVVGAWRVTFWGALAMAITAGVVQVILAWLGARSFGIAGALDSRRGKAGTTCTGRSSCRAASPRSASAVLPSPTGAATASKTSSR